MTVVLRKPAARAALETPYARANRQSAEARMSRGIMPKGIGGLLRWYSEGWDLEVPEQLHTVEVWHGRQSFRTVEQDGRRRVVAVWPGELVGGSALGSHADTSLFRHYMEGYASELDVDGYYARPMHAALARLALRDHWMSRNLFAVAQAGFDWQAVADRGRWIHAMYRVYLEEALRRLWREHSDQALRLQ